MYVFKHKCNGCPNRKHGCFLTCSTYKAIKAANKAITTAKRAAQRIDNIFYGSY